MTTKLRLSALSQLVVAVLLAAAPSYGQSDRGSVRGVVHDPSGAPVAGLEVTLGQEATGEVRRATTGTDGRFTLSSLPPAGYSLEVRADGFRASITDVELLVGQERWIEVALELGNVAEEVFVVAPRTPLDPESAALSTVINGGQIVDLPLDGRNFLELSLLAPGTAPAPEGSASSLRGDFAFTVNGGREDAQAFVLDGVYNIDPKLNTPGVRPPVDAIREFGVLTGTYDASLGRNAAGQVNVVTRSGTNQVHGTAYGFLRLDSLGARNFFAPPAEPRPEFNRSQTGFSLGGPLGGNTFFFGDYEHSRRREDVIRFATVPTGAERTGDFSASTFTPAFPQPVDPSSDPPGEPFPDDQIPSFFIHPVGQAIAALYPEPNRSSPQGNFVSSPSLTDDVDHFDARVDRIFEGGAALTGRYSFGDRRLFEPFPSATTALPGFGIDVLRRGQNLMVGLNAPLGTTVTNDTRVAWSRVAIGVFHENQGTSLNQTVGLPELSANPRDFGLSQITVLGFSPMGDEFTSPQESATDMWQVTDNLAWARGPHMIRTGFDVRHVRQDAYRDVQARGFLNFSGVSQTGPYLTGNALGNLLLGFPLITGGAVLDNPQNLRSWSWSSFVQDNWRFAPDVTLSVGLRYEYIGPAFDAGDRASLYDPETGTLVPVGMGSMPRGGYEPDRNNWGPRVGIAWTPGGAGHTVIRGGYGVYYNQGALAPGEGLYFSEPYFDLDFYSPLPADFPSPGDPPYALTLSDPFPSDYPIAFPASATAFQRDLQTGRIEHWSVGVQRQLGASRFVEVVYVGSRGHDLLAARDINQPDPSPAPFNPRPNPFFDDVTLIESRGRSEYDALQVKFQQRLERLSILSAYTLGQSEDDASGFFASTGDPNLPQDSRNPQLEFGRSSFDVRHRFSTSVAWSLPFGAGQPWLAGPGPLASILSEMQIQSVVTLESGPPFTVALLPEIDQSNTGRSTLGFGANDRPDLAGDPSLDDPAPEMWFDTGAFSMPAFGSFGSSGRNILDGPGYQNVNLGVLKHVGLGESADLQLRFESFNLLNRTNLNLPDAFLGSPTFGQVLSARNPRQCQFGLKLIF